MKNRNFEISFDRESGNVTSICNVNDKFKMNWCNDDFEWGKVFFGHKLLRAPLPLKSFEESDDSALSVFENEHIRVSAKRYFKENGNYAERYTIKCIGYADLFLNRDNFGIALPLNDRYTYAADCMTNKCNAHIWCAENGTYINALKMGVSDIALGIVLSEGSIDSYDQNTEVFKGIGVGSRGEFVFNTSSTELTHGEEYVIEWEYFWHNGEDFYEKALETSQFVRIEAEHHTVFSGEDIAFRATLPKGVQNVCVICEASGEKLDCELFGRELSVRFKPKTIGEYRICLEYDGKRTHADFLCTSTLSELIRRRIEFIVSKQQYKREDSPLYGAYLIYDNTTDSLIFDESFTDHNACRERIGMALLIAEYLKRHEDKELMRSLMLYMDFVKREFYDDENGYVCNCIGKDSRFVRLYNAPWLMTLFAELYILTHDEYYIDNIMKMADNYYSNGGYRFYPNGFSVKTILDALILSGRESDTKRMLAHFEAHVANMIKNGVEYPKHEVNYEQTIVTPAASMIAEFALFSQDKSYYAEHARAHAEVLRRFNGKQPSFHLNALPIRYWDDYWFGKSMVFGDTFPHYWSCLSARAFLDNFAVSNEPEYERDAKECLRNCLCLFEENGRAHCAYVFPHRVNSELGGFYDEWANDQDFALYFALKSGAFE